MNQTEATERIADALQMGLSNFTDYGVGILAPVDGTRPSVILIRLPDTHLSVTVQILAQS